MPGAQAARRDELFRIEVEARPRAGALVRSAVRAALESSPELERASFDAQSAVSEVVMLLIDSTDARRIVVRGARSGEELSITVTGLVERVRGTEANHELAFRLLCAATQEVDVDVARASEGVLDVTLHFTLD